MRRNWARKKFANLAAKLQSIQDFRAKILDEQNLGSNLSNIVECRTVPNEMLDLTKSARSSHQKDYYSQATQRQPVTRLACDSVDVAPIALLEDRGSSSDRRRYTHRNHMHVIRLAVLSTIYPARLYAGLSHLT